MVLSIHDHHDTQVERNATVVLEGRVKVEIKVSVPTMFLILRDLILGGLWRNPKPKGQVGPIPGDHRSRVTFSRRLIVSLPVIKI